MRDEGSNEGQRGRPVSLYIGVSVRVTWSAPFHQASDAQRGVERKAWVFRWWIVLTFAPGSWESIRIRCSICSPLDRAPSICGWKERVASSQTSTYFRRFLGVTVVSPMVTVLLVDGVLMLLV